MLKIYVSSYIIEKLFKKKTRTNRKKTTSQRIRHIMFKGRTIEIKKIYS